MESNNLINLSNNPLSNPSFKEAQSQSNKAFDMNYDFEDSRLDKNDLAYQVLSKSIFKFHIGKEDYIIYNEIEIGDNGDKKTIDEIKNYRSKNAKLNDKYIIFLERLKEIENIMKDEIENRDNLTIILEFSKDDYKNFENIDRIDIKCNYKTENPQNSEPFMDDNILGDWNKQGLSYFISSLKKK